jgi:hypothetical protein
MVDDERGPCGDADVSKCVDTVIYQELVAESALQLLGFGCKKDPKFPFPGTHKVMVSR